MATTVTGGEQISSAEKQGQDKILLIQIYLQFRSLPPIAFFFIFSIPISSVQVRNLLVRGVVRSASTVPSSS